MKLFLKDFDQIMREKKKQRAKKTGKYGGNYSTEFKKKADTITNHTKEERR